MSDEETMRAAERVEEFGAHLDEGGKYTHLTVQEIARHAETLAAAVRKPDPSPVCVEVKENSQTFEQWWLHHVMPDGQRPYEWAGSVGIGVIAERAFNAGRRSLTEGEG